MEKTNSRSSKLNTSDPKVKQDVTNKHLRMPRVKESISPRPEVRRKPNPQRNRELFDKRPRNRDGAVCERYRGEITEENLGETFTGEKSKKTNLNHLLNFTLSSLDNRDSTVRRVPFNRNKHPKYNKELFLQANCQFVARDNGNYTVHEKNPDILVEWPLIEEIRLSSHEMPLCPICLYDPVAGKITRCGHIYCWPCILHYLALTDRTWQKCPICFEAVHKDDLKSVSLRLQMPFSVGDEINMILMKREKGSLLTTPIFHESPRHVCNVNSDDNVTRFQKLLLANKKDIGNIISRERKELQESYLKEKDTPEACFIESALKFLEERESDIYGEIQSHFTQPNDLVNTNTYQRKHLESLSSTDSHDEAVFNVESPDQSSDTQASESAFSSPASQGAIHELEKKGFSYFYQAEDGQHIYMHKLNVRMLVEEYGSLGNAPPLIKAKIVEIESVSMTEVLRKKLRYLLHLPLTCEFQVVELNFSNLLKKSTIIQFEGEINKRKHFRNRKARDERRRAKFIEQEENKKLGKYPEATYNLQSIDQFPSCHSSNFLPLSPSEDIGENNNPKNILIDSEKDEHNSLETNNNLPVSDVEAIPTTSFAEMLKDGCKSFTQPSKENKRRIEVSQNTNLNVDSDGENWVPPPEYHQSFSDAIQAALDSVTIQEATGSGPKAGKKKKVKKQLLFTTSMCRNK